MKEIFEKWKGYLVEKEDSKKVVTFDFDDTLARYEWDEDMGFIHAGAIDEVISLIKEYKKTHKVYVVTSRMQELQDKKGEWYSHYPKNKPQNIYFKEYQMPVGEFLNKYDIKVDGMYFTNGQFKADQLNELNSQLHYDDDYDELKMAEEKYGIKGICVNSHNDCPEGVEILQEVAVPPLSDIGRNIKPQKPDDEEDEETIIENESLPYTFNVVKESKRITISLLEPKTNKPVQGKVKGDAKIIIEKRTEVPHWEVAWSNSPLDTQGIGTIMYLLALEYAGDEGLSPDSWETSKEAVHVWDKFLSTRNKYAVMKQKKPKFDDMGDDDPFYFVFFKPGERMRLKYKDQIVTKDVKSDPDDPQARFSGPEVAVDDESMAAIWDELDDLSENSSYLDEDDSNNVSKIVVLDENNRILLLKRSDGPQNWDLPGGHIKTYEDFEEGGARETKEETGLSVNDLKYVSEETNLRGRDTIKFYKTAAPAGSKIHLGPEEHIDFKWVTYEEFNENKVSWGVYPELTRAIHTVFKGIQEDFQADVKKKHTPMKIRLIGKGGNPKEEGPGMEKPSFKRSKSAPPGAGGA